MRNSRAQGQRAANGELRSHIENFTAMATRSIIISRTKKEHGGAHGEQQQKVRIGAELQGQHGCSIAGAADMTALLPQ